jgi:hypothetical protein
VALAALIVAVAAATVSLVSFGWTIGWSIWQHRRLTVPRVHVSAGRALFTRLPNLPALQIDATNVGTVGVTLSNTFIRVKGHTDAGFPTQFLHQEPGPLPLKLETGERWLAILEWDLVRDAANRIAGHQGAVMLRVGVTDSTGRKHETSWMPLDAAR